MVNGWRHLPVEEYSGHNVEQALREGNICCRIIRRKIPHRFIDYFLSLNGNIIAVGTSQGIRMPDAWSGAISHISLRHDGGITSLTFSHDGTRILSGSNAKAIRVWDSVQGMVPFCPHRQRTQADVLSVALVSSSLFELCSWDAMSGTCLFVTDFHLTRSARISSCPQSLQNYEKRPYCGFCDRQDTA
jgi:WD40 repeat protein